MSATRFSLRAISVFAAALFLGSIVAHAGTIDPTYKYAWSNVGGYVNFAPSQGGLTVTDTGITGYAWSANGGYINFDTNLSGVTNDGEGNLGGFAWGEGAGWISFSGVTIDGDGKFHGTANGGTVNGASYAITFDCANCDVRTDWRPSAGSGDDNGSGGSSGQRSPQQPPASELPTEPTTPPPGIPETEGTGMQADGTGGGAGTRVPGSEGTVVPGMPTGELMNPTTDTNGDGVIDADDAQKQSDATRALIVIGSVLGLLALFFLVWFFILRRRTR